MFDDGLCSRSRAGSAPVLSFLKKLEGKLTCLRSILWFILYCASSRVFCSPEIGPRSGDRHRRLSSAALCFARFRSYPILTDWAVADRGFSPMTRLPDMGGLTHNDTGTPYTRPSRRKKRKSPFQRNNQRHSPRPRPTLTSPPRRTFAGIS